MSDIDSNKYADTDTNADADADTHKVKKFIGRVLTGEKFIEEFPNLSKRLVKLIREKDIIADTDTIIKTGMCVDEECYFFEEDPRDPEGGIDFIDLNNIYLNLIDPDKYYFNQPEISDLPKYLRKVCIPRDCIIFIRNKKFIADKIELGEAEKIKNLDIWNDEEFCINAIEKNKFYNIPYIRNFSEKVQIAMIKCNSHSILMMQKKGMDLSEKIKLAAVRKNGLVLKHIKDPSEKIKFAAVKQNGNAIEYIKDPTEKIKLEAVKQNGNAIEYIKDPSEKIKLAAVKQNGNVIEHFEDPSEKVKLEAVNQNGLAYKYIKDIDNSREIKLAAVKQNGEAIKFMTILDEEIKLEAVRQTYKAIKYITGPSTVLQMEAVKQNASKAVRLLLDRGIRISSEEVQKVAVSQKGNLIIFMRNTSEEVNKIAVSQDPFAIQFIPNPSKDVQIEAVKHNGEALLKIRVDRKNISNEVLLEAVKQNSQMYGPMYRPPKCVKQYMEQLLAKK